MGYIWFLIALIFLWQLADELPFVAVIIAIAAGYFKAAVKHQPVKEVADKQQRAYKEISQLALLEQELKHLLEFEQISAGEYEIWQQSIDVRKQALCDFLWKDDYSREQQLDYAWHILKHSDPNIPVPPWQQTATVSLKPISVAEEQIEQDNVATKPEYAKAESAPLAESPSEPLETSQAEIFSEPVRSVDAIVTEKPIPESNLIFESEIITETTPAVERPAFGERKPGKLTQLYYKIKSVNFGQILTEIIWPFLWQNIGWFIAGFCIVFGSIYIVAYSSGFFKGLMILLSLSLYTGLLLFAGYQIRLKKPQLYISSYVSITLAVLLIPLLFTVAANLFITAENSLQFIFSLIIELALVAASIYAMQLATGLIERDLPKQYNYFFIALTTGQYFTSAIIHQHWLFLVIIHFSLAAILIYALHLCNHNWLQEIFLDKRRTSYYLVGTLFYTAIISFIYLTNVSKINLPNGYYGLCLTIFCAALFYIDRSIQTWLKKPHFLNHLSFVIYGLSVVAILIAAGQNNWHNAAILTITLLFSTALYAAMLWNYISYPPLYLLLISSGWLYNSFILSYFNFELYFLFSLPFFYGLKKLHDFAIYKQSTQLAIICYRFLLSGIILLLTFSLYSAQPSITAMVSPLMAALLIYKIIPQQERLESRKLAYFNIGLITLSAYYTPLFIHSNTLFQFCIFLILLAGVWLGLAIKYKKNPVYFDVFLNSLLLSLILNTGLAIQELNTLFFPSILIVSSFILVVASLTFFIQEFFYLFLILLGYGIVLIRKYYFLESTGLGSMIAVFFFYGILWFFKYWRLQHNKTYIQENILNIFGINIQVFNNKIDTCQRPLELSMYFIWLIGLWKISNTIFNIPITSGTALLILLSAISSFLITIYSRQAFLLVLNIILLFYSLTYLFFVNFDFITFLNFSAVLMLALWFSGWYLFNVSSRWLQVITLDKQENLINFQQKLSHTLHNSIFSFVLMGLISLITLSEPILTHYEAKGLLLPFLLSAIFFATAGYYYKERFHSYFVIFILIITGLLSYSVLFNFIFLNLLNSNNIIIYLLAVTAILTFLFNAISIYQQGAISVLYYMPLRNIAFTGYFMSIILAILIKIDNFSSHIPFLFLATLTFPLFSLHNYLKLKGFLIPVLLTLFALHSFNPYWFIGWSFILWGLGYYGFTYLNKLAKRDIISADFSSSLGLFLIAGNLISCLNYEYWQAIPQIILFTTVYLCLMLNYSYWHWLRWLTALGINLSGVLMILDWFSASKNLMLMYAELFIWQNLLLMLVPVWEKYFSAYKKEIRDCLNVPLQFWVLLSLLIGLIFISMPYSVDSRLILMSIGLNISLLHILWRFPKAWLVNIFLYSLLRSWLMLIPDSINLSLQIIVWAVLLQFNLKFKNQFERVIYLWFFGSFIIGLGLAIFNFSSVNLQFIASLVLLIYISYKEWRQKNENWLTMCSIFSLILLHSFWLLNVSSLPEKLLHVLPYYTLQDLILIYLIDWSENKWQKLSEAIGNLANWLLQLALVFWLIHAGSLLTENYFIFNVSNGVAILDLLLLAGLIIKSYQNELDKLVYYLAVILAVIGGYLHLCLFGLNGFNYYDALLLLMMSYLLLPLNYKLQNHALYKLNFFLPLPALLAASFQASFNNSLLLLSISVFYLLLPRRQRENSPIFLALIIFNFCVYLWIPYFSSYYNLFSLYIVPASVTILLMLQLHSVELKPSLYHSMRLFSLAALYSGVSIDIWLNKEMSLLFFIIVLLLSLAGIIAGISLKIRAFLYCGSLFFIANVIAQLVHITPENHLTKGIFLFVLGGIIFVLMIWFQMQREEILQRVRIFRADLASWE